MGCRHGFWYLGIDSSQWRSIEKCGVTRCHRCHLGGSPNGIASSCHRAHRPALDGNTATPISGRMDVSLQASNGPPQTRRRMVDAVQRIGPPPARTPFGEIARATLVLVVDGVSTPVGIETQ